MNIEKFHLVEGYCLIYKSLLKTGVIVRPISDYDMPNHLRVTIGVESENDKFIKELQKIMVK